MAHIKAVANARRYLNFSLGDKEFAIPLQSVKEVIAVPEARPVPQSLKHFLGITNLRGDVVSLIDLRIKLSIEADQTPETAVIICEMGANSLVGMVVSSINAVLAMDEKDITQPPQMDVTRKNDYIMGIFHRDKKLVLLLDIAKTLEVEDHSAIQQALAWGQNKGENQDRKAA